jgi:hypothetical protein
LAISVEIERRKGANEAGRLLNNKERLEGDVSHSLHIPFLFKSSTIRFSGRRWRVTAPWLEVGGAAAAR